MVFGLRVDQFGLRGLTINLFFAHSQKQKSYEKKENQTQ
jgi:hypothetical protein